MRKNKQSRTKDEAYVTSRAHQLALSTTVFSKSVCEKYRRRLPPAMLRIFDEEYSNTREKIKK
jgi:hypothetical protein